MPRPDKGRVHQTLGIERIPDPCEPPCNARHYQSTGKARYYIDGVRVTEERFLQEEVADGEEG